MTSKQDTLDLSQAVPNHAGLSASPKSNAISKAIPLGVNNTTITQVQATPPPDNPVVRIKGKGRQAKPSKQVKSNSPPPPLTFVISSPQPVAKKSVASLPQHISSEAISALLPTEPLPPNVNPNDPTKDNRSKVSHVRIVTTNPSFPLQPLPLTSPSKLTLQNSTTLTTNTTLSLSTPTPLAATGLSAANGSLKNGQQCGFPVAQCKAEIVSDSVKELRTKGSSFLRSHASKHGITNASRKLTSVVVQELVQHYTIEHKVNMKKDDACETGQSSVPITGALLVTSKPSDTRGKTMGPQPPKVARISSPPQIAPPCVRLPPGTSIGPPQPITIVPSTTTKVTSVVTPMQQSLPQGLPQHPLPPTTLFRPTVQMPQQPAVLLPTTPLPVTAITPPTSVPMVAESGLKPARQPQQALTQSTSTRPLTNLVIIPVGKPRQHQSNVQPQKLHLYNQQHPTQTPVVSGITTLTRVNGVSGDAKMICTAGIIAKTRNELAACGTSLLRPEAAAHKVHNASRKMKDQVIEELWDHYVKCHAHNLALGKVSPRLVGNRPKRRATPVKKPQNANAGGRTSHSQAPTTAPGAASGWVGSVVDDEDNT